MGNSEVGHLNMGAGRIVYQELTRITKEIQDGDFFKNEALLAAVKNCKREQLCTASVMGLLSDGGVHSHNHTSVWSAGTGKKRRSGKSICTLLPGWS